MRFLLSNSIRRDSQLIDTEESTAWLEAFARLSPGGLKEEGPKSTTSESDTIIVSSIGISSGNLESQAIALYALIYSLGRI